MKMISIILMTMGDDSALSMTLDSILKSDYSQYEVVIVDRLYQNACFTQLLDNYANTDKIRYLALPNQSKDGLCYNAAIPLARGEYVTFLTAGTQIEYNWLSSAVKIFDQYTTATWCYARTGIRNLEDSYPPSDWKNYQTVGKIFPQIITKWSVILQSIIVQKEKVYELGGFDENLTALVEEEFVLRLAESELVVCCQQQMVEVEQKNRTTLDALMSRCYFLSEFRNSIFRGNLQEKVLTDLLDDISKEDAWELLEDYLNILSEDKEYQRLIQSYIDDFTPKRTLHLADTQNVSGVQNCVGCGSCKSKCPADAITMEYNEEGFLYPVIDELRCTKCGICLQVCPTQQDLVATPMPNICYAMQAKDAVRMKASSGGMFPVLAAYMLEMGGYVSGAIYDHKFHVRHIVSNQLKDVRAMQTSKYVQSSTVEVYPEIEQLLKAGKYVLFTGCACQIAGLHAFLSQSYENLFTMDVVCHGVPSPGVFHEYLKELQGKLGTLKEVSFRKKELNGWRPKFYARSIKKIYENTQGDLYMMAFSNDWDLRETCYHCEFKNGKYSDITVADFWGIQALDPEFEDGKGSSYVTINTPKGLELLLAVKEQIIKQKEFGKEAFPILRMANPNIWESVHRPKFRDYFFEQWKVHKKSLMTTIRSAYQNIQFDVGLVLFWGPNHGNALTNYALYQAVSKNHTVLAIDNCVTRPPERFKTFALKHYNCSSDYFPFGDIKLIEQCCNSLLVGSDQVWSKSFAENLKLGTYFQLGFAGDKTRKLAYGASFGSKEHVPIGEEYAKLYKRFDRIGVREQFGVEACQNEYGVKADFVLDPVFLLEPSEYEALAEQSTKRETEPFIFSYIFFPTADIMKLRKQIQERLGGIKIISTTQANWETREDLLCAFEYEHPQRGVTVENWLYYIKNAEFVITDSFHASCFSIFFNKRFAAVPHAVSDRFTTLCKFGDVAKHISCQLTPQFLEESLKMPDYEKIHRQIAEEREKSLEWLEEALQSAR